MDFVKQALNALTDEYIYNPQTNTVLPQAIWNQKMVTMPEIHSGKDYREWLNTDDGKMYQAQMLDNAMMMSGGVNFTNKVGSYLMRNGKFAGSLPAVKERLPYFGEKGSSIVKDALGNLRRMDLPQAIADSANKIPFADAGQWIQDAAGNLKRIDLPIIK